MKMPNETDEMYRAREEARLRDKERKNKILFTMPDEYPVGYADCYCGVTRQPRQT